MWIKLYYRFPLFRVAVLALAGGGTSGHSVAMEGQTDPTKSRYLNINENCLGGHNHLQMSDQYCKEQMSEYQKRNLLEIFLGDTTITSTVSKTAGQQATILIIAPLIACEDNHRWQQAGPQPWVIIKPQQATTTIDHHYSYPYVGKNPDNNKQSS